LPTFRRILEHSPLRMCGMNVAPPKSGRSNRRPPERLVRILKLAFIDVAPQPRKAITIATSVSAHLVTNMPLSLDSTHWKLPSSKAFEIKSCLELYGCRLACSITINRPENLLRCFCNSQEKIVTLRVSGLGLNGLVCKCCT